MRICTQSMRFPPFSAPVSVVIPALNAEAFLGEALASVREQRTPVLEIIVVDDGSTDESARVAVARGARVVRLRRSGPSAARNVGIRIARGTWVAFLDADDVWERGKIARQLEAAALFPEAGMVACDRATVSRGRVVEPSHLASLGRAYRLLAEDRVWGRCRLFPPGANALVDSGFVPLPSTVMVRRGAILSVGLFDEALHGLEDYECFMRVLARFALVIVEMPLVRYRVHGGNTHLDAALMEEAHRRFRRLLAAAPERYPVAVTRTLLEGPYASAGPPEYRQSTANSSTGS
jgi:glycosyltransferase involved in cell wall biosynthesis